MPDYTLTVGVSTENITKIVEALDHEIGRKEGETGRQLIIRDLRRYYSWLVYKDARRQAGNTIELNEDIAEVT